jgi:hypothetical protein
MFVYSTHDHVRRLRALIERGMASPQNELTLKLLLLYLYSRRERMVEVDQQSTYFPTGELEEK